MSAGTHTRRPGAELAVDPARPGAQSAGAPGGTIARSLPEGAASGSELSPRRGVGRPQGATNIRDTESARALIESYGDPLEAEVAIGNADLGGLVTLLRTIASDRGIKLGGTLMDIARWQADCRRNALPYLRSKRAPIGADGKEVPPVVLGLGRYVPPGGSAEGAMSIEDRLAALDVEAEQDQKLSGTEDGKSHDG